MESVVLIGEPDNRPGAGAVLLPDDWRNAKMLAPFGDGAETGKAPGS